MSNSKPIYDATANKICRELSGLDKIGQSLILHQVCEVLDIPKIAGYPGLSTPSPPQAAQITVPRSAITLLTNVLNLRCFDHAKLSENPDGMLVLELPLGRQTEK